MSTADPVHACIVMLTTTTVTAWYSALCSSSSSRGLPQNTAHVGEDGKSGAVDGSQSAGHNSFSEWDDDERN